MTITQLTNSVCQSGKELQAVVKQSACELASIQAGLGVNTLFRPSYTDSETGMHGVRWLIARILTEAQAVFPKYAGQYRNVYLAKGLTTESIIAQVRATNGFDKYPDKTIWQNLCVVMRRSGQVASIRMNNREDNSRNCKVPRIKWYLVAE